MSYVIAAYVVVLVGVAGYALYLARERRALAHALDAGTGERAADRG